MNSIDAMEAEIRSQPKDISRFRQRRSVKPCLFVGSGDSYAAGLAAQNAFRSRALCCGPLELVNDPSLGKHRAVYIISVSGMTAANIRAAKVASSTGLRTIAVTANTASPLAHVCDQVLRLTYHKSGITTAGTASFLASMITCMSLAGPIRIPKDAEKLLKLAEKQADELASRMLTTTGTFIILGDSTFRPIAVYGGMKLQEVLGVKAIAYSTEEFCHAPIFSAKNGDGIIILGQAKDRSILAERLASEGLHCSYVPISGMGVGSLLHSTFVVQMFALKLAQQRMLSDCYFLTNRSLLQLSSDFIYG